jgi:hypothetical protein
MFKYVWQVAVVAASGLALVACVQNNKPETSAPDYQAAAGAYSTPANIRAICYDESDLGIIRTRMVQQQIVVGVLQCKSADGSRTFDAKYAAFLSKFGPELSSNAASLSDVAKRKRANVDVLVTEIANRTANHAQDQLFCSRHQKALEWSLQPQVTSLTQVPSPLDLGPEMTIFACPKG